MATAVASAQTPAAQPFNIRAIMVPLVAIIMGTFMVILDTTAVNVSLPTLVVDFKSSIQSLQWILTGYTLAQAAVIPLAGWLSDRFGAKRVFLTAVALFTLGSVLCSTSQSTEMLIFFRLLQGLGGGFVMPVGMAYTYRLSPPDKRGMVMGMLGVPMLFAPALGPTLAGWLVQYATWRWIFLINLPVGIVALLVGSRRLPNIPRQAVPALDLPGIILGPLAFAALSYGVNEGSTSWTSVNTIGGLMLGVVALLAFIAVELRVAQPLLELRVFRSIDFTLAIVTQWIGTIALFGGIFLVPLFLQQVRGYGAFDTGLTLMAQAIAAAVFMPIGGRLFDRFGARPLTVAGLGAVAVATFLLAHLSTATSGWDLVLPLAMRGMGMSLMMMPLNTHLLNAAPRALVGRVTSLTNALQNVVNSLAIASLSTVLASTISANVRAAKASLAAQHVHVAAGSRQLAFTNAAVQAFNTTLLLIMGVAIVGALIGVTLRRNLAAQQAHAGAPAEGHAAAVLEAMVG
jgi:EmrB/QacA subfamily drug resistance transporter